MSRKLIVIVLFLCICAKLLAQTSAINQVDKNGKKQGHWIKKDEHGIPVYEGVFKDGKPQGEFNYFYDTKEIKTISVFSSNGTVCHTKHFFPGNILMAEGKYVNEKRDSIWKFYNAPNSLVSEESFKIGKKDGLEKNYDGKGKIVEEKTWKDSILNGPWKKYYENGNVQQEGVYMKGLLEGEMKFYYPGKTTAVSGMYKHSLKNGKWTYFDNSGKIITQVENYVAGDLLGYYAEWSARDGAPKVKGEYKQDKKNAKWSYFNEKGKLHKDSSFFIGYINGACTEYYENGNKKSESVYYFSKPTGKWTEWDEAGKIIKEENHDAVDVIKKKMAVEEKLKKQKKQ